MEKFVDFASGKTGRTIRLVVGAFVECLAVVVLKGNWARVLGVVGVLLMLSGVMKVCILNKLVGRKINACPN